jgi:hypothetical protein
MADLPLAAVPDDLERLLASDGGAHGGLDIGGIAYAQDVHHDAR